MVTAHPSPLNAWSGLFSTGVRRDFSRGTDITMAGKTVDEIYLVSQGAVVETRAMKGAASHAVHFSAPGGLIGFRMTSSGSALHEVRATALVDTTVQSIDRQSFLSLTMRKSDLVSAMLIELANRTETARLLSHASHETSTRDHLVGILSIAQSVYANGELIGQPLTIPIALLERISGCPWTLIRSALGELRKERLIEMSRDGVRLRIFEDGKTSKIPS